jgi:hypothetical protein
MVCRGQRRRSFSRFLSAQRMATPGAAGATSAPVQSVRRELNWCVAVDSVWVRGACFCAVAGILWKTASFRMLTMRLRSCRMVMSATGVAAYEDHVDQEPGLDLAQFVGRPHDLPAQPGCATTLSLRC